MFVLIVTAWKTNPSLPYPIKRSSAQTYIYAATTPNFSTHIHFPGPVNFQQMPTHTAKQHLLHGSHLLRRASVATPHSFRPAHSECIHERCLHLILEAQHQTNQTAHTLRHSSPCPYYDVEHVNLFGKRSAKMAVQFLLACRTVPVFYPHIPRRHLYYTSFALRSFNTKRIPRIHFKLHYLSIGQDAGVYGYLLKVSHLRIGYIEMRCKCVCTTGVCTR